MKNITYRMIEGVPDKESLRKLSAINQMIFGFGEKTDHLKELLESRRKPFLCFALDNEQVVGYKIGFQERRYYFESWRGGVLESHRKQGIAQELMKIQHEWCRKEGFRIVTTITDNQNNAMLIANLRGGFTIVGSYLDRQKHVKILLQKWLVNPIE